MTNGEKLLEVFPNSRIDTKGFIWGVGFLVALENGKSHTLTIDREWFDAEYQETETEKRVKDEAAYILENVLIDVYALPSELTKDGRRMIRRKGVDELLTEKINELRGGEE